MALEEDLHKDNTGKVSSILDTSFLSFRFIGHKELFQRRSVMPEGVEPVVNSTIAHMSQIQGYLMHGDVIVSTQVQDEISRLQTYLEVDLQQLFNGHASKEYRHGCSKMKTAVANFRTAMRLYERSHAPLDPTQRYDNEQNARHLEILDMVRFSSPQFYNGAVTGKVHSAKAQELDTDRKLAALAIDLARSTQVVVYTNDKDLSRIILDAMPIVSLYPDLKPKYAICRIMAPNPDENIQFAQLTKPDASYNLAPVLPITGHTPFIPLTGTRVA